MKYVACFRFSLTLLALHTAEKYKIYAAKSFLLRQPKALHAVVQRSGEARVHHRRRRIFRNIEGRAARVRDRAQVRPAAVRWPDADPRLQLAESARRQRCRPFFS